MHGDPIGFTLALHWYGMLRGMKTLYLKHLALHLAGLSQAGFGFLTRQHGQWIGGKSKLLLAKTYHLQYRAQRARLSKPAAIRRAG